MTVADIPPTDVPFTTCDISDELADEVRVIGSELKNYGGRRAFRGPAATIKCFEDNSLVRDAVSAPGAGQVLVVDGGGSRRCALLGDMLAKSAVRNGWSGIVIDGCVRDSAELRTLDIGIKARGTNPRKSHKFKEGQRDVPVSVVGVAISPGDSVFADDDGIVVVGPRISTATRPTGA